MNLIEEIIGKHKTQASEETMLQRAQNMIPKDQDALSVQEHLIKKRLPDVINA